MNPGAEQEIWQTTMVLPFFDEEVPVLCMSDGTRYIPVIVLCTMLGLPAKTHIPRWRRLMLWSHVRKLPFRTRKGSRRVVWCLHLGAFPLLCACFHWDLVSAERRIQLRQAVDAWNTMLDTAHQELLMDYRFTRRLLFAFLTTISDRDVAVKRALARVRPLLDQKSRLQLDTLVQQGNMLMQQAQEHARALVQEQTQIPVIDVFNLSTDGQVSEACSLPLLPVTSPDGRAQFFEEVSQLTRWYLNVAIFLVGQGM